MAVAGQTVVDFVDANCFRQCWLTSFGFALISHRHADAVAGCVFVVVAAVASMNPYSRNAHRTVIVLWRIQLNHTFIFAIVYEII